MKKFSAIFSVVVIALVAILFAGCDTDYNKVAGSYYLTQRSHMGSTLSVEKMVENGEITDKTQEVLVLNADKTFSLSGLAGEKSGTYEITDSAIVLKTNTNDFVGTFENNLVTISIDGDVFYFHK